VSAVGRESDGDRNPLIFLGLSGPNLSEYFVTPHDEFFNLMCRIIFFLKNYGLYKVFVSLILKIIWSAVSL
jgi:hypothetical protein